MSRPSMTPPRGIVRTGRWLCDNSLVLSRLLRSGRILRRRWALTAIAVFSLSIAMALCIVTASVANTFVFARPAAVAADRLVAIYARSSESPIGGISYPDYQYFRATNHVFSDIAATPNSVTVLEDLNFGEREVRVFAKPVSDNYLTLMGDQALSPADSSSRADDESKTAVAVMTYFLLEASGIDLTSSAKCWRRTP